jgi:hypothetical protein
MGDALQWLHASAPATWMREAPWAWPAVEALHILGFAVLFGSVLLVDLRVLGFGGRLDGRALAQYALRATRVGAVLALATGLPMFAAHAPTLAGNIAFRIKLALLAVALANAAVFHWRSGMRRQDALARCQAALSITCWTLVIICGRGIAYV